MSAQDPAAPMDPEGLVTPDPNGPQLTPVQWGILWALLYIVPDAANAPIRAAIENYFQENGLDMSAMHRMAEVGKALAEQSYPPNTPQ